MNDLKSLPKTLHELRADTPPPREAWLVHTRNRLSTEPISGFTTRFSDNLRRNSIRWVALTATASVVGVVAVGILPFGGNGGGQFGDSLQIDPAAAAVLQEAANNAENAAPVAKNSATLDGKYVHHRSRVVEVKTMIPREETAPVFRDDRITENWYETTGRGSAMVRETMVKREPVSPVAELEKAGVDLSTTNHVSQYGDPSDYPIKPHPDDANIQPGDVFSNPTPAKLAKLPTDPDKLLKILREKYSDPARTTFDEEPGSPEGVDTINGINGINGIPTFLWNGPLGEVIRLLYYGDALLQPELRKALFLATARLEGIERYDEVELEGHKGIALGGTKDGARAEMVIDPEHSRLLGFRTVVVSDDRSERFYGQPKGTVLRSESVRSAIVDKPGQTQ